MTGETFDARHIKFVNGIVKRVKADEKRGIIQHRLDKKKLRLIAFTDSSFANNYNCSTQLGFFLVLTDDTNRANILHYSSYKSKRIVRAVLGGETYVFTDWFDVAFMVRNEVERMVGARVSQTMLNDS